MIAKASQNKPIAGDLQPAKGPKSSRCIEPQEYDAVLLDLDGVVTETAKVHAEAWKTVFDEYLRERAARLNGTFEPFDLDHDYKQFVDGKPRYDGVADFLQSRSISLPPGGKNDPPEAETICGLAKRKNRIFLEAVRRRGVGTYRPSVDFIRRARSQGLRVAVVTASRNCKEILKAAGIETLFDLQVDGNVVRECWLDGKPAPDSYLEAARRLGVKPGRAAIIEDAVSGVQAGKAGEFGLVVGLCHGDAPALLKQSGADIVVSNLSELNLGDGGRKAAAITPLALEKLDEVRTRIGGKRVAVFLDYDGTLTPIAARPELAVMSEGMRAVLKALMDCCTVLVISGRERGDVERLVGLKDIIYAGCHGFNIAGSKGMEIQHTEGKMYPPLISQVAEKLSSKLAQVDGIIVENKTYAVAVHFRMVKPDDLASVERAVDDALEEHPLLRKTVGKKVFELRPNISWDKGKAVLWLLDALDLDGTDVVPLCLGDDVTDLDAFRALRGRGISILVAEQPQPSAADYRLSDPAEVQVFLEALTTMLHERAQ